MSSVTEKTDELQDIWDMDEGGGPWHIEDMLKRGFGLCGATPRTGRRVPSPEIPAELICPTCRDIYIGRYPGQRWIT